VPHYVYKYASGFCISVNIVKNIIEDKTGTYINKYIEFLSKGNTESPIILLKNIDINILTPKYIENALEIFKETLENLEN
jgi:oligoendopeptidase F